MDSTVGDDRKSSKTINANDSVFGYHEVNFSEELLAA